MLIARIVEKNLISEKYNNHKKSCLKIDYATYEATKYACENWHYSGVVPVGKLVKIGAWENNKFIGVVVFGRGANNNMLKPFNLEANEGCELVRIALCSHIAPVSKILSIAIKFLKKTNSGIKLIVSYADADQGHYGGIYQATNWTYTGLMNAGSMGAFIVNGKKLHPKSVHSKGVKQSLKEVQKHLDKNATKFFTKGKHRYVMALDKNLLNIVLGMAKPYPKKNNYEKADIV